MKNIVLVIIFISNVTFGQITQNYIELIKKADSLYTIRDYKNSSFCYSLAFKQNNGKGYVNDRYNAARSWAMAGYKDSAFENLNRITINGKFDDYYKISIDPDFISLHDNSNWLLILDIIKKNKETEVAVLNDSVSEELNQVLVDDQKYRVNLNDIEKKFGSGSKEMNDCLKMMVINDSINLKKVQQILDQYGWLGSTEVGDKGSTAIFLVIQHSNLVTQEKYLPLLRDAVKHGKTNNEYLALLEDRVAIQQGKKQIYGSQIGKNIQNGTYYILPLQDPQNVDKRRKEVGLNPLQEYVSQWGIIWNPNKYVEQNKK